MSPYSFPSFDQLPKIGSQPQGCLWGFFDRGGEKDQIGTLNLLTDDVVKAAAKEVLTGKHVQLDWSMSRLDYPGFGRIALEHTIHDLSGKGFVAFDDEIKINTQTSSQWDGWKHWGLQKQQLYYNGLSHEEARKSSRNGIHNICRRGGIVGRGVLVDWLRWWEHHHPGETAPSPVSTYKIPVAEIEQVLEYQGTECHQGDIFIMRTGMVRWHENSDTEGRIDGTRNKHNLIGIANNMDTVRWLYSKHFAAVAGDAQGFEAWPYPEECCLHEWLLAHWGTPVGELWDLEGLSVACENAGRWSFLFTSAPLNVEGGVASPPGAIAIL